MNDESVGYLRSMILLKMNHWFRWSFGSFVRLTSLTVGFSLLFKCFCLRILVRIKLMNAGGVLRVLGYGKLVISLSLINLLTGLYLS